MNQNKFIKRFSNLNEIKKSINDLRRKVSQSYCCIEFGYDYIQLAEAYYSDEKVNFRKIIRIDVPNEAIDKGIPSDPIVMGNLILETLREENYFLKRAAIVLPPESSYSRLIELPRSIKKKSVHKHVKSPESQVQIPISINQTDFAIYETDFQLNIQPNSKTYQIVATPKASIDNLIKTCEVANLELNYVEVGFNSISRLINYQALFQKNKENQFIILLEFLQNCTNLSIMDENGPIYSDRIVSIRNFPLKYDDEEKQKKECLLPISKLDLKVLANQIKRSLNIFFKDNKIEYKFKIVITGINSQHPNLVKTLSEYIGLPTYLIAPTSNNKIGNIKLSDENYYESNFVRIFGLGLGLIDNYVVPKNKFGKTNDRDLSFIEFNSPEIYKNIITKNKIDQSENLQFQKRAEDSHPRNSKIENSNKENFESKKIKLDNEKNLDKKENLQKLDKFILDEVNSNEENIDQNGSINYKNDEDKDREDQKNEIDNDEIKNDFKFNAEFLGINNDEKN